MNAMVKLLIMTGLLTLVGCVPSTNIKAPLTARPAEPAVQQAKPANGAIFQAGMNERPLFEDRRARNVGDVLTINIVESTSAVGRSARSNDASSSIGVTTPTISGGVDNKTFLNPFNVSGGASVGSSSKADSTGSNNFTGAITVTVIEVLANGNLRVAGEKQVAIQHANEYVRFSGTVNPINITGSNAVQSTQVADVQLEYKNATKLDTAALVSMLGRFFMSVLPF